MQDISPQNLLVIPAKEKIQVPETAYEMGEKIGGMTIGSDSIVVGQGDTTCIVDTNGLYLGNSDYASAPFWVNMSGDVVATSLTLTGGTVKSGKTSFSDSANTGYYIGTEGLYAGAASDATKLKFTIADGTFDFVGTHSGGSVGGISVTNVSYVATTTADSVPTNLAYSTGGITIGVDGSQSAYAVLTWTAISSNTFDHYVIRYRKSGLTYYTYVTAATNTITIDGLLPNITYDFGIASVNKYGSQSAFSSNIEQLTVSDTVAPATVTYGSATAGIQYIIVEWTHNTDSDLASYNIYRHTSDNSGASSLIGNCRTNYFVDGGRTADTEYFYWIKGVDTSGNISAAFSTVVSATPRNVTSDDIVTLAGSKVLIDGEVYLSNWRKTGDLTMIDGGSISTGSVTTTQLNFTPVQSTDVIASINASEEGITIEADNITIAGTTTFTSGWAAATDAETDINVLNTTNAPAAAGADVTGSNTAADTSAVNGLASSSVSGWAHGSDTTKIDGGNIYAGSVTATQITVTNLAALNADLGTITAGSISVVNGANTIGLTPAGANAIFSGTTGSPEFAVTPAGALTATSATITGAITAGAGSQVPLDYIYKEFTAYEDIADGDAVYVLRWTKAVLGATDDTFVNSDSVENTYCANQDIYVGGIYRAFIKFNLTGHVKSNNMKVVMRLRVSNVADTDGWIRGWLVSSDWSEASCPSYSTKPTNLGGDLLGKVVKTTDTNWIEFDITPFFIYWLDNDNYGLRLTGDGIGTMAFHSSEAASADDRPQIVFYDTASPTDIGKIGLAKADDGLTSNYIGIAKDAITAGNTGKVVVWGEETTSTNLSDVGGHVFLSADNAGKFTESLLTQDADDIIVRCGQLAEEGSPCKVFTQTPTFTKYETFEWGTSSGWNADGIGTKIIYTGFRPSLVKLTAVLGTNGFMTGISNCTGAEGGINQVYYYQDGISSAKGTGAVLTKAGSIVASIDYVTDNYIVLNFTTAPSDTTQITVEAFS